MYEHIFPSLRTLFDTARGRGDDTFLVYEDERLSFADVMAEVDAIAAMLVDHYGVTKGDRVAIGMRNYPEWITSFAAITSIGAVAVSLNAWWTVDEMTYGLEDSGTRVLIADQERAERAEGAFDTLGVRTCVVRSSGRCRPGLSGSRTCSSLAPPCPRSSSTPTTTPPSSTPRAPPATPRARCPPTGPCCTACSPSPAGPPPTA